MPQVSREVLDKAKEILQYKEDYALCIKAGICPVCGEKLIEHLKSYFGYDENTTTCSVNSEHYYDTVSVSNEYDGD